jgi:DNA-binding PadR family transcriptional regulator
MGGAMSDLLSDARDLRQKLYRLEVLLQIENGRRSRSWFTGKVPEDPQRTVAMRRLVKTGLIEAAPPPIHFRLTPEGRDFLKDVRAKVSAHGELDWTRADEIDFSKL